MRRTPEQERERLLKMMEIENELYNSGYTIIAGVDEAGRGPLAGPVSAAAVILPKDTFIEGLNDSKKLSIKKREELFDIIKSKAIAYNVAMISNEVIDTINILNATKLAMKIAVEGLKVPPEFVLVDALTIPDLKCSQKGYIHGDALSVSIAAASVLAKVTRDRLMIELDEKYPEYNFKGHKGYGTKEHYEALRKYGPCEIHRSTFLKVIH